MAHIARPHEISLTDPLKSVAFANPEKSGWNVVDQAGGFNKKQAGGPGFALSRCKSLQYHLHIYIYIIYSIYIFI